MKDVTSDNFGILITYLLPGSAALYGTSFFSRAVSSWIDKAPSLSIGGFLYVTLAAMGAGLVVSTVRWAVLDTFHHRTGITPRNWNYARLPEHIRAFEHLVRSHYDYYKFYSNSFIAVAFSSCTHLVARGWPAWYVVILVCCIEIVFWAGARDTLRNYYLRVGELLGPSPNQPSADNAEQLLDCGPR